MHRLSWRSSLTIFAALAALLVGCGGSPSSPSRPATLSISCRPGSMGASERCNPKLGALLRHSGGAGVGQTGIDLSNNDPSYEHWPTIRRHAAFAYFKVSEGTGFIDSTAQRMAREARAAGLFVGGYDFQHVCGVNAFSEADVFILAAKHAELLTGAGVLPPTADFEQGTGCNAKAWLGAWSRTVRRITHDAVYSDPGFYNPSVGCFSEADYGWVADLTEFVPLCGLNTLFRQYSWNAWDGVDHVDGDVFRGSYAQLQALASVKPEPSLAALYGRRRALRRVLSQYGCRRRKAHREKLGPRCTRWFAEGDRVNREIRAGGGT